MISKATANYRECAPNTARSCGTCVMFRARRHQCDLVRGLIQAPATCDRWAPKEKRT